MMRLACENCGCFEVVSVVGGTKCPVHNSGNRLSIPVAAHVNVSSTWDIDSPVQEVVELWCESCQNRWLVPIDIADFFVAQGAA